jgi:LysM domain
MQGDRYVVRKGDNLCRIAHATLGRAGEWPRIWKYNNRPEVVRITGRAIPDPDLIYVGQLILIPRFVAEPRARPSVTDQAIDHLPVALELGSSESPSTRQSPRGRSVPEATGNETLAARLQRLRVPVAYKFELGALHWPVQNVGAATVRVSMSGHVLLVGKESYPANYVVSGGKLEGQLSSAANHAFGKLVSKNTYTYEPSQKRITMKSMLIAQSNTPNTPAAAVGVEVGSGSAMPKLKAEIKLPRLDGQIGIFKYVAVDVTVALEVTPNPQAHKSMDSARGRAVPVETPHPVAVPANVKSSASAGADAELLIGAGIIVTGSALALGTVIEDFLTWGLGIIDDAPTLSLGAATIATGVAVMRGMSTDGLPKSLSATNVSSTNQIVIKNGGR